MVIASQSAPSLPRNPAGLLKPPFDLICTADTVYHPSLIEPLLRTLHALSVLSMAASPSLRAPPAFLCIERRDPSLVDRVLADAKSTWNFNVDRVPDRKLRKAMEKGGVRWDKEDWEGIEIWKLTLMRG